MKYPFLVITAFTLFACGDDNPVPAPTPPATDTSTTANQQYFPVIDFLRTEIATVDSLPVALMQYRSSAKSNDSGYIKPEQFHAIVDEFVPANLTDTVFKKDFKEASFLDKATGGATFFYNTDNSQQDIKRIDVVTEKTDTYDKVKSIYIEKINDKGDSTIVKKLHWKPGRNFQLVKQVSKGSGDPETELIKVVWDNRE